MYVITFLQAFLKDFVLVHWVDILIVLGLAVVLVILWRNGKRSLVKKLLYGMIVRAEKALGSKTGQEKLSVVLGWYTALPWYIRLFFTQAEILQFIKDGVTLLKRRLQEEGITLLGYEEEIGLDLLGYGSKPPDVEITP